MAKELKKNSPIGLFDSGVGGLTVAHALHTLLPGEQLIYFGDTAHLPYGDKSREAIVQYSLGISDFLLDHGCKVILIACNSASANAFDEVKAHVGDRAVVMNVIDPVVNYVCSWQGGTPGSQMDHDESGVGNGSVSLPPVSRTIGIIGTKATIDSGTYEKKILTRSAEAADSSPRAQRSDSSPRAQRSDGSPLIQVNSLATPLFVPMIEEGFVFDDISNAIIRSYMSRNELEGIDSLILGCTHYPIIRNQISRYFDFDVQVHDTAQIVAAAVKRFLSEKGMLNPGVKAANRFYVSDHTTSFEVIANMFFNEKIPLEKNNIWL